MVSETVDGFVCDLDGVIYRGDRVIDGAPETVRLLRNRGARFVFCSNNSRTTLSGYRDKLEGMGIPASEEEVLTSAVVLSEELKKRNLAEATALVVGGEGLRESVAEAGLHIVEGDEGRDADVVAVGWDHDFTYDKMRVAVLAVRAGALLLASNDDASFPAVDGLWPGAGAILASIEVGSGTGAEVVGKPREPMRRAAAERLRGCDRIAVVGDRVETDIEMGRAMGWQTILVLSGVTSEEEAKKIDPPPDVVVGSIADLVGRGQ
jgi:4-nitrophenyl phosphatase